MIKKERGRGEKGTFKENEMERERGMEAWQCWTLSLKHMTVIPHHATLSRRCLCYPASLLYQPGVPDRVCVLYWCHWHVDLVSEDRGHRNCTCYTYTHTHFFLYKNKMVQSLKSLKILEYELNASLCTSRVQDRLLGGCM